MQFFCSPAVRLLKCLRLGRAGLSSELHLTQLRHIGSCYQSPRRGHAERFQLAALPQNMNCCMYCVISCPFHEMSYLYCDKQCRSEVTMAFGLAGDQAITRSKCDLDSVQFSFLYIELQNRVVHPSVPSRSRSPVPLLFCSSCCK